MTAKKGVQWLVGLVVAGFLLLLLSIFVADRQLAAPFEEVELAPVDVPTGSALASGLLLYSADATGNDEVYTQPFAGGAVVALTSDPAFDSWRPRLSPDRRTILFYRTPVGVGDTDTSKAGLWMMTAQGDQLTEVLPPGAHGWTTQGQADWSPVGDQLVMVGSRPQGQQIWVTSPDGRAVRNLVNDPGDNIDPSWSPDGSRVLYVACPERPCADQDLEIFTVLSGGGERIQVTSDEIADRQPQFSPDGTQIVVRSQVLVSGADGADEQWDIRVFPTSRNQPPRRLVADMSNSSVPHWLDDRTVVFQQVSATTAGADIMMVRVSDGQISPLVNGPANERYPTS